MSIFLQKGQRFVFTIALFVLVFAAASVVKTQAGMEHNRRGWLWSENIGWVSMNNLNTGSAINYGVNIPANGEITGYAWSENIGWISFEVADLEGCPSEPCTARRNGDYLEGWARILAIKDAAVLNPPLSGGWQGWISLKGTASDGSTYGVQISKMLGVGSGSHTYAWSNEIGWIDFGQVYLFVSCANYCSVSSSGVTISNDQVCRPLSVFLNNGADGTLVTFAENSGDISLFNNEASCIGDASVSGAESTTSSCNTVGGFCETWVKAYDFSADRTATVNISTESCGSGTGIVFIAASSACTISAPSSISILPGLQNGKDYDVIIDGECVLNDCVWAGGSEKVYVSKVDDNTCHVWANSEARYEMATSQAVAGSATANTVVNVKLPGWIEVSP